MKGISIRQDVKPLQKSLRHRVRAIVSTHGRMSAIMSYDMGTREVEGWAGRGMRDSRDISTSENDRNALANSDRQLLGQQRKLFSTFWP